jgi:hypothetical protein
VQEINKSRKESRSIVTGPVTGEQVCFPLAEQAALLLRQTEGRKDELVALITSVEPWRLDATNWLRLNRDAWGIENGLHQRLVSRVTVFRGNGAGSAAHYFVGVGTWGTG